MAVFKCKMCGGRLDITERQSVTKCAYCGSTMTLPRLDSDRKENLYDRANHFRRNDEFDKAMGIYEMILQEDKTDAEAYWSLVLCRYGIEYVEDPATGTRVPTCNRVQLTPVQADEDYKAALKYADPAARAVYEAEAAQISEIQKGILQISQKEEPFDVFLCYKETARDGSRTQDSVLAQQMYYELTKLGLRVFFSRITLEGKLGQAYEPYIFAALNSARVMVVVGTCKEHINAAWVRNEWGRYLSLIKGGAEKSLIPAYRDMDPYDLPEEFSHLQALDMGKLGFMQDLVAGVQKLLGAKPPVVENTQPAPAPEAGSAEALVKRGYMALEDAEFDRAEQFFENALNLNAEHALAYMGKFLREKGHTGEEAFWQNQLSIIAGASTPRAFDGLQAYRQDKNYTRAIRFATGEYAQQLASREAEVAAAVERRQQELVEEAEQKRLREKERTYQSGLVLMREEPTLYSLQRCDRLFRNLGEYKDAQRLADECLAAYNILQAEEDKRQKVQQAQDARRKKWLIIIAVAIFALFLAVNGVRSAYASLAVYPRIANEAEQAIAAGDYPAAIGLLETLPNTQGKELLEQTRYDYAVQLYSQQRYNSAMAQLNKITQDSTEVLNLYNELFFFCGLELMNKREYEVALQLLESSTYSLHEDMAELASLLMQLQNAQPGQRVQMGYGGSDFSWRVMQINDAGQLLLFGGFRPTSVSLYYEEWSSKPFATENGTLATWETLQTRQILNGPFFEETFRPWEAVLIQETEVHTETPDGGEIITMDRLFFPSREEYLSFEEYVDTTVGTNFWLREHAGNDEVYRAVRGEVGTYSYTLNYYSKFVMWVDTNIDAFEIYELLSEAQ